MVEGGFNQQSFHKKYSRDVLWFKKSITSVPFLGLKIPWLDWDLTLHKQKKNKQEIRV